MCVKSSGMAAGFKDGSNILHEILTCILLLILFRCCCSSIFIVHCTCKVDLMAEATTVTKDKIYFFLLL